MNNYIWILQLVGIIITVMITVGGTSWKVSRIIATHETVITKIMSDHQLSDTEEFAKVRVEIDQQGDIIRREFGETGLALRQGIHNLEISLLENKASNLETFARRQSMIDVNKEMVGTVKELVTKVDNLGIEVAKITSVKMKLKP